jgi:uncharacterized delta-60 repeat protein/uncharacterized repeat protein (TIGR01451 family)
MRNVNKTGRWKWTLVPLWLLVALLGTVMDANAQTAPANDNLTNAQPLLGTQGSVTVNNQYATTQLGESGNYAPVAGVNSGASVWFLWTALKTNWMSFDTRYSTDPYGNTLNTAMAVYSLTGPNSALVFGNLTKVASNQQDPNTNSWPGTSRVTFPAIPGTTYLIQVDGTIAGGVTNEGYIVLNWHPAVFAGVFYFSTNNYVFGQYDNEMLWNNSTITPSLMNTTGPYPTNIVTNFLGLQGFTGVSTASAGEGRITVERGGAYNGRVQVDLVPTGETYTNVYSTNIWGTNILIETLNTNFVPTGPFTNIVYTNINTVFSLEYDNYGSLSTYLVSNYSQISGTNGLLVISNNCASNAIPSDQASSVTVIQTNFDATMTNIIGYVSYSTNLFFSVPPAFTNLTPGAVDGVDYYSSDYQTLTFDDYQMSKDAFINILPSGGSGTGGPDWPDNLGNFIAPGIPRRVIVRLQNPRLDPLESLDVAPPIIVPTNYIPPPIPIGTTAPVDTFGPKSGTAVVSFEDIFNSPINVHTGVPNSCGALTVGGTTGFDAYNIERRTFRVNKPRLGSTNTVTIYVIRDYAETYPVTVNYSIGAATYLEAGADYAVGQNTQNAGTIGTNFDYVQATGSVTFPANQLGNPQPIPITINNFGSVSFDTEFTVTITMGQGAMPWDVVGNIGSANVVIQFDNNQTYADGRPSQQQPGGAADRTWNVDNSAASYPPLNSLPGANEQVEAIACQADGKSVVGGQFVSYDSTNFSYLVRTLVNGLPDFTFNPGTGPGGAPDNNNFVSAIAIDANNRILIGGNFTSFNGVSANYVARLNPDGSLDSTFNTGRGANGTVWALALDPSGNVLIGGDFTAYNSTNRFHVARLLGSGPNAGSLDTNFDPGLGTDGDVRAIGSDSAGNVLIGGSFSYVNGTNWPGLARFLPTGALDTNFNPGTDVNGVVYSLGVQPDNKIVIGGSFSQVNLTNLSCIARINVDGSVDHNFNPGSGANGPVFAVALQPDQKVLIGGQFNTVETVRRVGYARLLTNGWVDTSFLDTSYNQFAGLINHYYNPYAVNTNDTPIPENFNEPNYVNAIAVETNGNVMIGGSFKTLGGGNTRDAIKVRWNLASVIGAPTLGPQPYSAGILAAAGIGNYPGNVGFTQSVYSANDTAANTFISVSRVNGSLGPVNINLNTNTLAPGPGAAGNQDFGLINNGLIQYLASGTLVIPGGGAYAFRLGDGAYGPNNNVGLTGGLIPLQLTIFDPRTRTNNLFANLDLALNDLDTFTLGGMVIPTYPAPANTLASLEIINDNFPAGTLGFSATNYNVTESGGYATITVLRTNGSYGAVSVNFRTQNGFTNDPNVQTAIAGQNNDYIGTNGTLNFANGATSASFQIQILNHSTLQSNKFLNVILSNPTGGAGFDTNNPPILNTNSVVTIVDDHFQPGHLSLTSTAYSVTKGGAATIGVQRTAGALGIVSVQVVTSDGTGTNGINYTGVTNTLQWTNGDVSVKTVSIQTLEDHVVEGTRTVNVKLTNALVADFGTGAPTNSLVLISPTNAVLSIADDDSYGTVAFAPGNVNVLQNGGSVLVTVARTGGTVGTISVNFATANASGLVLPLQPAVANVNYVPTNGTLTFGPGVTSQSFRIPILYTPSEASAANRVIAVNLSNPNPLAITNGNPFPVSGTVTILDNQLVTGAPGSVDTTLQTGVGFNGVINALSLQPDGKLIAGGAFTFAGPYPLNQVARLNADGSVDSSFLYLQPGSDGLVQTVLSQAPAAGQTNGSIMVAGSFAHFDGVPRNNIARLNTDGSLDETFNPGSGADNTIYTIVQTSLAALATNQAPVSAYLIGGAFVNFNGVSRSGIARITATGQVDPNFNPGNGVTSTNGTVHAIAVQADGKVIVGGDFTSFNNFSFDHLVRLNLDGSVDQTFQADTGAGINGSVHAIVVQPDGNILVGGVFTNVNGVTMNHIARLTTFGALDVAFTPGVGANDTVESIALDSQGRILLGGQFTRASGVTRNAVTRLNPDGTVDSTINFGSGANGFVRSVVIQANDEINVGGSFSSFGGYVQNNFTRLFGGEISGPGSFSFTGPTYGVVGNQTNALITVQRIGGTAAISNLPVTVTFSTSDGTALNQVDYVGVTNLLSFPTGETFTNVSVPIINNGVVGANKYLNLALSSPSSQASLAFQSTAQLFITNANSAVAFSSSTYRQSENVPGGAAVIPVVLIGSQVNTVYVTVSTGTNGTASPGNDYTPVSQVLIFPPGVTTNLFVIPLLNNPNMHNDQTVDLELSNPTNAFLTAPSSATLTIATVNAGPGVFTFSQPSYVVSEGATNVLITVLRTNGLTGPVSVTLSTSNGTATAGINYQPVNQLLNFSDGEASETVSIPIIQQTVATPDTTVFLLLTNAVGTTVAGPSVETLTIQNDLENFTFASPDYFVSEGSGVVTISVLRNGPTNGTVSVGYTTFSPTNAYGTNGFAIPGYNYGATNGTLVFAPGQTFQTIPIAIFQRNTVDVPETFQLVLTNASAGTQIGPPGSTVVTIIGNVSGFNLATNAFTAGEDGETVVVTVNRLNVNTGTVSVDYATHDGTAVHPVDYLAASGTLTFADGQASTNVTLTINARNVVEGNKTFTFALSNPSSLSTTNIYILSPSNAVITITNTATGLNFSAPSYSVNEKGVQATITVLRSGLTTGTSSVQFSTSDGTGVAGVNYFSTNGVLTFAPGVTSQSFTVTLIDDHVITADHTVYLNLANQTGAVLSPPTTAVLTIQEGDGSYIVAAGTALVSESFHPTNGLIDPGETITVLLGLRDVSGGNTTNLVATLQTNSGVTPGALNSQNYGALIQGGYVVSRPFTFTATGANNQVINAVLQLQDGSRSLQTVAFSFTLGVTTTTFSNNAPIIITNLPNYGSQPTPAIPYPSSISVAGIASAVGKVTVTFSNLTHALPSDIEAVLQSPSGATVLLMNDVGGNAGRGVTNFTVTFDDNASNYLSANQLVNNAVTNNKPTPYITDNGSTIFVGNNWGFLPMMPGPVTASSYPTNLSVLAGTQANGNWSLYIADTQTGDYGQVSNGWNLNLSTGNPVASYSDLELSVIPAPALATTGNNLVFAVTLTNYGPAAATGVNLTNIIPAGLTYLSNNFAGTVHTNNGILTFSTNGLAVGAGFAFNIYTLPTVQALVTNMFIAIADQLEASTNNATNVAVLVSAPSADLAISIVSAAPNPVVAGDFVTLTVVATNAGPSLASGTFVTNYLPAGLAYASSSASVGTVFGAGATNVWNIGTLAANSNATLLLTFRAVAAAGAIVTNNVEIESGVTDPFKDNDFDSFKIFINPAPTLSISSSAHANTFTWSTSATNFVLQGATNLTPPVVWVTVTNPAPTISGGQYSITLPTNSLHFFKLTTAQ